MDSETTSWATASGMKKLVIESEEKVAEFFVDGEDQGVGVFTSKTHPSLGGAGRWIVEPVEEETR